MKKVFDNAQCAHVWAQQSQDEGRSNNSNLFFEGRTIYSYGRHFPLATFWSDDVVFINDDSYSVSTSKHQGYVRQAVNHKTRVYVATNVMKILACGLTVNFKAAGKQHAENLSAEIERLILKAAKANKVNKPKYLSQAHSIKESAKADNEKLGFDFVALEQLRDVEGIDLDAIKAEEKRKAQAEAKIQANLYAQASEQFLNYETIQYPAALRNGPILIRVKNDDTLETSRGASFPISHAKAAFKTIRFYREAKAEFVPNGKTISIGHFKIDAIDKDGNVKAGCHFIEWQAIENIARELKIFP